MLTLDHRQKRKFLLHFCTVSTGSPCLRAALTTLSDLEEVPLGSFFLIITGSH
jgi:hypothetical protein